MNFYYRLLFYYKVLSCQHGLGRFNGNMIQLYYFLTCLFLECFIAEKCSIYTVPLCFVMKGETRYYINIFANVKNIIYTEKYIFQAGISVDFNFGIASSLSNLKTF